MPAKKGNEAATPKGKAAVVDEPSTVTSTRSNEFQTTAAAGRTRRQSAIDQDAAAKIATATNKRGRPAKASAEDDQPGQDEEIAEPPRKRGRPAKAKAAEEVEEVVEPETRGRGADAATEVAAETPADPPKRGRGRPRKAVPPEEAAQSASEPKRGRGRPRKAVPPEEAAQSAREPKRGRGRPRKAVPPEEAAQSASEPKRGRGRPRKAVPPEEAVQSASEPKRGRGRPKKLEADTVDAPKTGRGRGRPKKADAVAEPENADQPNKRGKVTNDDDDEEEEEEAAAEPPKKRGRSAKETPAVPEDETAPPRKRGRPPKGGETTQASEDQEAAEEQLENELIDEAKASDKKSTVKGKGRKGEATIDDKVDRVQTVTRKEGERMYWLMKAEQEDRDEPAADGTPVNVKFTIDDLKAKTDGPELWDGVRNYQATKNMREMQKGDLAFFYASGGKKGRTPGITGIMEVVAEQQADPSAYDQASPYYEKDEKKRAKETWIAVGVEFRKKLTQPVGLAEMKKYSAQGTTLSGMDLFTKARLSVSRVSEAEWKFITEELIEGYKEEEETEPTIAPIDGREKAAGDVDMEDAAAGALAEGADAADDLAEADHIPIEDGALMKGVTDAPATADTVEDAAEGALNTGPTLIGENIVDDDAIVAGDTGLPDADFVGEENVEPVATATQTVETELPTTDTMAEPPPQVSSRPPSRAPSRTSRTSRQPSLGPTAPTVTDKAVNRPASRAGSRAPSVGRPASRAGGRSRAGSARPSSRQGSLAPSAAGGRPVSRGRSRTPGFGDGSVQAGQMMAVTEETAGDLITE